MIFSVPRCAKACIFNYKIYLIKTFGLPTVLDYAYRDYILSWYIPLSRDEGQLYSMLSEDWWQMIGQLRCRLADIDLVNVVCYDTIRILHTHFTGLKAASARYTLLPIHLYS